MSHVHGYSRSVCKNNMHRNEFATFCRSDAQPERDYRRKCMQNADLPRDYPCLHFGRMREAYRTAGSSLVNSAAEMREYRGRNYLAISLVS